MKRIAYLTDIHLDEKFPKENSVDTRGNWKLLLEDISVKRIDEIVFGGDIGERESNQWFFESLKNLQFKITLGNHDHLAEVLKYYNREQVNSATELYYAYEDTAVKYIFLDSSSDRISDIQFSWLRNELMSEKKILLFIHHPVLPIETAVDKLYPLAGRETIRQELQHSGSDIFIFCGHYHMADERSSGNITQIVTPSASFQIKKESTSIEIDPDNFGYRIILIDGKKIHTETVMFRRTASAG
ncbi:MAG TPA: metallophosphoesterase [Flavisolibacter sp.]|jgi:3',5'-cyclic AMP phosphodiesterase CpdA|nr:metallophosphoesterase [Flavisolibacter sp.]